MGEWNQRPRIQDKRLINCRITDVNQLMPIRYRWAWEHYLNGCANNWFPHEISMGDDLLQWKSDALSDDERLLLMRNFGFFSTAETLVANNLALAVYKHISNAECRLYILRQAFEEAVHAQAFLYICESLSLDEGEVFNMYREVPVITDKEAFQIKLTANLLDPHFSSASEEGARRLLENLIGFYLILEGIFFYGGFAMVLAFQRVNKMRGICQMYEFILRDETIHLNFGIDLINGIIEENPHLWTPDFKHHITRLIKEAVDLEARYTEYCLSGGIFGLKPAAFRSYIEYLADRRLERIGLKKVYASENPLDWMSEAIDLHKEKNFFEQIVTEYRPASDLRWTD
ncbi:MAG: ribonucleotide-diphosphate reductase subunit beta [Chlamydiales bacterium]|nr:ribonucleotide-diphosphate reductase subunit beta [Chlamydiales bacterium]